MINEISFFVFLELVFFPLVTLDFIGVSNFSELQFFYKNMSQTPPL
jgi:nitrate reductase NapE component